MLKTIKFYAEVLRLHESQNTFENQNLNVFLFFTMKKMTYLFTSESVSEWHPDKVCDQISDAIVDAYLAQDSNSKVACETLVTTNKVVLAWEVKSTAHVDVENVARDVIRRIGYTKNEYWFNADTCDIEVLLHEQSADISRGVERENVEDQWAGDQWIMFGYACNETDDLMPLTLDLSHKLLRTLAEIRKEKKEMLYLRPDAKSQFTIEYSDDDKPLKIKTIILSTQHDEFASDDEMLAKIREDVNNILLPRFVDWLEDKVKALFNDQIDIQINPTGKFVIWWPNGDTGVTWRKIIVDTYGGKWAHWWGAFSGKDPSKVDRSGAYMARYIAKNLVAAGIANRVLIQVSYAIWIAKPLSVYVDTYWTSKVSLTDGEIAKKIWALFDLRPYAIEKRFNLRSPIYEETAAYGHFGRECKVVEKYGKNVELFPWEKLDSVDLLKKEFGIN